MNHKIENTNTIIVAAGIGKRVGGDLPKQYQNLKGTPILAITINCFLNIPQIDNIIVVINKDHKTYYDNLVLPLLLNNVKLTFGGHTRKDSVYEGLKLVNFNDVVLIHDGARPFVKEKLITDIITETKKYGAAAPGLKLTDSIWEEEKTIVKTSINRMNLFKAQTPQGFYKKDIENFYKSIDSIETDDVGLATKNGLKVKIIDGDAENIKITTMTDIENNNNTKYQPLELRTGIGYDVHAFEEGTEIILCGLRIPYKNSLKGHSDADVSMHAITDSLYGAIAEGDIGTWFSPEEADWKNADSEIFLNHANKLLQRKGFIISNIDCTIICEEPKIKPHVKNMRQNLADILEVDINRISIKATTSEKLGFIGRHEGIATQAIATVLKN